MKDEPKGQPDFTYTITGLPASDLPPGDYDCELTNLKIRKKANKQTELTIELTLVKED